MAAAGKFSSIGPMTWVSAGMQVVGMMSARNNQKVMNEHAASELQWTHFYKKQEADQQRLIAARKARKEVSERRAALGMRGIAPATGSSLMEMVSAIDDYEEQLYWIQKNLERGYRTAGLRYEGQKLGRESKYMQMLTSGIAGIGTTLMSDPGYIKHREQQQNKTTTGKT
jgi:hypothetical protein